MSNEHPGWSPGLFTIPGMGTGYVDNSGRVSIEGRTAAYILPNGTIKSFGGAYLGSIGSDGIVYGSGGTVEDVVNDGYSGSGGKLLPPCLQNSKASRACQGRRREPPFIEAAPTVLRP